jgi:integrase
VGFEGFRAEGFLTTNPGRRLERRRGARRGDRSIPRARLDKLLTDDRHGLRGRVLWQMLDETAARAEELLSLNIEDFDLEFRRGRVTSKGGAIEYVHWATGTARLLPRAAARPHLRAGVPRRPARRVPVQQATHTPGHLQARIRKSSCSFHNREWVPKSSIQRDEFGALRQIMH